MTNANRFLFTDCSHYTAPTWMTGINRPNASSTYLELLAACKINKTLTRNCLNWYFQHTSRYMFDTNVLISSLVAWAVSCFNFSVYFVDNKLIRAVIAVVNLKWTYFYKIIDNTLFFKLEIANLILTAQDYRLHRQYFDVL